MLRLTVGLIGLVLLGCAGIGGKDKEEVEDEEETAVDTDCGDDTRTFFIDEDGDGLGSGDDSKAACSAPDGYVDNRQDCDDDDEDVGADLEWYDDQDGDGYGDPETLQEECEAPSGTVDDGTDCDDEDRNVNPGEDEACDGTDNDCDGLVDDDDDVAGSTWYADNDGDGYYGDEAIVSCDRPSGYGTRVDDCDDDDSAVNPGENEVCNNGVDDDCDESPNECALDDRTVGDADALLVGEDATDNFGYDLGIGDVTGDGRNDLVVAAYLEDGGTSGTLGAVYVFATAPTGTVDAASATKKWAGTSGSGFAFSADVVGDTDDDGYDDVLIGAPAGSSGDGDVYLYAGASRLPTSYSWHLTGPSDDVACGMSATGKVDIDDDGVDDLAFGCSTYALVMIGDNIGFALVNSGAASDAFGNAVALIDLDGDGTGDVVTGDSGSDRVYLWEGPFDGESVYSRDATSYRGLDTAGAGLENLGDVDGDGHDDLGVTGLATDAFVVGGASSGALEAGAMVTYDGTIGAIAGGDVDADGRADVVLGAPNANSNAGGVYIDVDASSGTVTAASLLSFTGGGSGDQVGKAVAVGDLDDDGVDDIAFGAPLDNDGGTDAGAVYIVKGTGW